MKNLLTDLAAPDTNDPVSMSRWSIAMTIKVYLLAIFTVWAMSFIPGFPGFAMADDVKELRAELKTVHVSSLEWNLFDLRVKQCALDTPPPLKQAYGEKIGSLLRNYYTATGQNYHLQPCEDLR